MLEIAVIKPTTQSSESASQNARKPVSRDSRDENTKAFQNEYEAASEKPKQSDRKDTSDSKARSDSAGNAEKAPEPAEEPKTPEKTETEAATVQDEDLADLVEAEPKTPDAAPVEGKKPVAEAESAARTADTAIAGGKAVQSAAGDGALPTARKTPGEDGQVDVQKTAEVAKRQSGAIAESIVMSKAMDSAKQQTATPETKVAVTPERVATPSAEGAVVQGKTQTEARSVAEPGTQTSQKLQASGIAAAEEGKPSRAELRAEARAEAPTPSLPARTGEMLAKPPMAPVQPFAKMEFSREKSELSAVINGDLDGFGSWETRSSSQSTPQSLGQILARAETPSMIARQMAEVLQRLPDRPVEISLNPRELGRVRMNISAAEAGITVSVIAERPETLDLMRRNIDQLMREFQSIGYENINFAFSEGETKQGFSDDKKEQSDSSTVSRLDLTPDEGPKAPSPTKVATTGVDIRL